MSSQQMTTACFAETTGGDVMGFRYDGVDHYLGIQYGSAERFQPATAFRWQGLRYCMVQGEVAPQSTPSAEKNPFDAMNYSHAAVENEKLCLQLNVWTPKTDSGNRPVLVWLHGGGFFSGSSVEYTFYEGKNLAGSGDVVFVSINHRLNCLGYLDLSAYGDQYKYTGNLGMTDLILALEWVRDNINAFGGNPGNVTIMGQSGGGSKVTTLMGMPSARNLFHRAAAFSGGSDLVMRTTKQARAETETVVKNLGLNGQSDENIIQHLTRMPYADLENAGRQAKIFYGPVVDGDIYPDGTYALSKDISFLCGNVLGEFSTNFGNIVFCSSQQAYEAGIIANMTKEQVITAYEEKYGDYADDIMTAFQKAYPDHPLAEGLFVNNRSGYFSGRRLAETMVGFGGTAYNYVAAYSYPMFGGIVAIHTAGDIPLWFNNTEHIKAWIAGDEKTAIQVSEIMSKTLLQFARTGNPALPELAWEAYNTDNEACMVFDRKSMVRHKHDRKLGELIGQAVPEVRFVPPGR